MSKLRAKPWESEVLDLKDENVILVLVLEIVPLLAAKEDYLASVGNASVDQSE